jgi:hypothetical protein
MIISFVKVAKSYQKKCVIVKFGVCGDLAGADGFNFVFECGTGDDFREVVKAA